MDALSSLAPAAPRALLNLPGAQPGLPAVPVPAHIPTPELQALPLSAPASEITAAPAPAQFDDVLGRFVGEVNDRQVAAADKLKGLLSGQDVSLHETMISLEEASLSFQLMVEVRNKLLESYQELMRMQI